MQNNTFSNPRLTPAVLRELAAKLKSGEIPVSHIIGFDLGATLKKKPADDRPAFADDPRALAQFAIEYTQLFLLMAANPDAPIVPSVVQDEYGWHVHLMKPVAYATACQRWAGMILDHEGGFGLADEELPILYRYFEITKRLWEEAYGESHPEDQPQKAATCFKAVASYESPATCFKSVTD